MLKKNHHLSKLQKLQKNPSTKPTRLMGYKAWYHNENYTDSIWMLIQNYHIYSRINNVQLRREYLKGHNIAKIEACAP